jgi:signal transduction histidine kinase
MRLLFFLLICFSVFSAYPQYPEVLPIEKRISESTPRTEEWFQNIMALAKAYRPYPYSKQLEEEGMPKAHYQLATEALAWAIQQKDSTKIAQSRRFLIDYYCYAKDNIEFIALAGKMVSQNNFASLQDKHFIYLKLAEAYKASGFISEYIDLMPPLHEIGRQLELVSSHAHEEFSGIGMAYYFLKDYKKARDYFKKSLNILKQEQRPFAAASVANNIGLSFSKEKQIDSARHYFSYALRFLSEASAEDEGFGESSYNLHFSNVIKANIGYLHVYNEDYELAIDPIKKELETAKIESEYKTEIQAYQKLAFLYYKLMAYDQALEYLKAAEAKLIIYPDNTLLIKNLDLLAKVFLVKGRQYESDELFQRKNELQDSIASADAKRTARIASVLYEVKKKDLEIKNQQSNIALLAAKNKAKGQLLLLVSIGLVGVFSVIVLIRSRNSARRREKLKASFSQGLIDAQEGERNRLALDLHDSVGQQLTMLTRKSRKFKDHEITSLATDTLNNLRAISRNLHPNAIKQLGFTNAIEDFINQIDRDTEVFFTLDIENIDDLITEKQALHLYRIIQEVISNIIKHANARSTEVKLSRAEKSISLKIKDTGVGFDHKNALKTSRSLGMHSILERSKILNAKIKFTSKNNQGSSFDLILPVTQNP